MNETKVARTISYNKCSGEEDEGLGGPILAPGNKVSKHSRAVGKVVILESNDRQQQNE